MSDRPLRSSTRLGPGGKLYVVVAAILLVAATYTQVNLLFICFGLMIGGFVCSVAAAYLTMRNLTVTRLLPTHGMAGDTLALRYRIGNRNRWLAAFGLLFEEQWKTPRPLTTARTPRRFNPDLRGLSAPPCGWVLHVGPQQTVQAEARCWPTRRGTVRFERVALSTSFPFGIVRRRRVFDLEDELLVYPQLYRIKQRVLLNLSVLDSTGRRHRERAGGQEEFFGLRHYREGDSLKQVDWKHSAKTGKLVSREMTRPSPPRIMLALDLSGTADESEPQAARRSSERAVSLAGSIICDAYLRGFQIGMVVLGVECPMFPVHHSLPHRTRMLEALARLDLDRRRDTDLPATQPSVIVLPGHSEQRVHERAVIMSGADLHRYIVAGNRATADLLPRRPLAATRRDSLKAHQAWN